MYCLPSKHHSEIGNLNDCSIKEVQDDHKNKIKELYNHSYKICSLTEKKPKGYRKLLIDGFDDEQIFQQIQLHTASNFEHLNKNLAEFNDLELVTPESNQQESADGGEITLENSYVDSDFSDDDNNKDYIFDDDSDSTIEKPDSKKVKSSVHKIKLKSNGKDIEMQSNDEDKDLIQNSNFSSDNELDPKDHSISSLTSSKNRKNKPKAQKVKFKSIVDDQFFKLSNLDEFLKIEDMKDENKMEEDDESIDYYQDISSDDFDEEDEFENESKSKKSSKDIMYDDFFDAPESGDENANSESETYEDESNYNNDLGENGDEDDALVKEEVSDVDAPMSEQASKTPFEIEQEEIKEIIEDYEDRLVKPPEWHLTGEVAASNRPKDSLLKTDTDFDVNAKPVLIEDSALNEKIEKMIKSIIKNKAYNDNKRKFKTNEEVITLKRDVIVDQTKSKKSLAAVYEDEYLKKKYGEEEQENPKHVEIKKMMDSLLPELQALFTHIPKPAIPDIKIVSNLPAITVEDVAPTSISDVNLLAPEEVKKKTGIIKGVTERSDTDRKRERRKKKMMQKMKFKKAEAENSENPLSIKDKKQEKINTLKKLKQNRYTKIAAVSDEKIKSSKDFFSRLQETVNSKDHSIQSKKRKKK